MRSERVFLGVVNNLSNLMLLLLYDAPPTLSETSNEYKIAISKIGRYMKLIYPKPQSASKYLCK